MNTVEDRAQRTWSIVKRFRRDIAKRRGRLAGGTAFAVIYALARVAEPWPLKVVIDQVLLERPTEFNWLIKPFTVFGYSPESILAAAGVSLAILGLVRGMSYYWQDFLLSRAAQEIVYGIRARLYRHMHRLSLSFHQRRSTGDLLVRLSSDIVLLRDVLIDSIVNLSSGLVLIVLMLVVMVIVDPVLTLAAVTVMPIIVLLSAFYGTRIRSNAKRQRRREGQAGAIMHEALSGMSVVQLHGAEEREQERFHAVNRRSLKQGVTGARLEARMNRNVEIALAIGTVIVMWIGALRAMRGALTPGELVVFITYLRAAYRPLRRASKTVQRSAKAISAAERILEILDTEPELKDRRTASPAPALSGRIEFERVSFAYEQDEPVLQDVSFSVEPGARLAVVGATGSGKSTLLRLVPRLYDPDEGRISVDGINVRDVTLESLREQVALVEQDSVLFGLSLAENIRYGKPEATEEEVLEAAEAAGVDEFVDRLPDGYDTIVSERGSSLSGGQRQRVALARALIRRCPILLLDEPGTGLDPVTSREVLGSLHTLNRDQTSILVTHNLALVRDCDEILVLEGGRIVARGDYETLLRDSAQFRRLTAEFDDDGEPLAPAASVPVVRSAPGPRRVLFYSHNGVGVGHFQRQLDLATAYRERHPDAGILLATGSHAAGTFEVPGGIDYLKLPSLVMVDRYRTWCARDLPLPSDDVVAMRAELLEQAVRHLEPELLVADFLPAGPHGELLPALAELERIGGTAVAGFRDVIDDPAFVRELWEDNGTYAALRRFYSAICVYGDPATIDFAAAYGLDATLASRLRYCGYLGRGAQPTTDVPLYERPLVIATGGGGVDGATVLEPFVEAARDMRPGIGGTWLMVTGPLMDAAEHDDLQTRAERAGIEVRRVVPALRSHVALADCLVAMAGYNAACDVLSFRLPAVLVPRHGPSREQALRAERLEAWGAASVVPPGRGCAERLGNAIAAALEAPRPAPAPVRLDGLERALDVFETAITEVRTA